MADENKNLATETEDQGQETQTTYTLEEVQKLLQQEGDKRVSQAQKKFEKQFQTKLSEAQKLAAMTEEQRHTAELESKIKELESKEQQLAIRENSITALKVMADKGIPASLVDLIVHEDADTMNERIKLIEKAIKDAVSLALKDKLKSPTPQAGSSTVKMTREQFGKLTVAERMKVYQANPELYKEFTH